jgi:hypothetical protein
MMNWPYVNGISPNFRLALLNFPRRPHSAMEAGRLKPQARNGDEQDCSYHAAGDERQQDIPIPSEQHTIDRNPGNRRDAEKGCRHAETRRQETPAARTEELPVIARGH